MQRRQVVESLGSTGPQQRVGAMERPPSSEERALAAAHDAARTVVLMFKASTTQDEEHGGLDDREQGELADLLDGLYEHWEAIGAWKPGEDRVPVVGEPGKARVDWEG